VNRSSWPTATELLQQLPGEPADSRSVLSDQLRWLGRYGLADALRDQVARLRSSPHWAAPLALEASLAWLLAGDGHQADLAFLEADALDPSLALVPDPWGLWPVPPEPGPTPAEQRAEALALASRIRAWRRLDPVALAAAWQQRAQADWTEALSGSGLDELVLLLRLRSAAVPPIEPFLASLVGEEQIAASPAEALRFWAALTDIAPDWVHARIKAADLALTRGETDRCAGWIATAPPEVRRNPWYWDIAARQALDAGAIAQALDHWGQALAEAPPELAEVFRQRRRQARRGPGLLQARALLKDGQAPAALALLQRLVADDPQWQPLRSLLLEAETAAAGAGHGAEAPSDRSLQRFARHLERAAARIGITLPPAMPATQATELEAIGACQQLERFSRSLAEAEARFALES
jgi:tetratricopeptide (TPR) repeat protein